MPLPALALQRLRHALREHPDIDSYVKQIADIDEMSKSKLTVLANKIGIDAKAIINKAIIDDLLLTARSLTAHRDEDMPEQWKYAHRYPAFKGSYEFDLSMELFGERVARRVKAKYEHTPEWEYFDLHKKEPFVGWEITRWSLFVLTVPDEEDDERPTWVKLNDLSEGGIIPGDVWEHLYDAIDDQCKAEDAKRRLGAAKTKPLPPKRGSGPTVVPFKPGS